MKFEITMSKPTFRKIRELWESQDCVPRTDAVVIKELFFIEDRNDYCDLRSRVKVKKVED